MLILPPPGRSVSPFVCRCRKFDWSCVPVIAGWGIQPIRRFHFRSFHPGYTRKISCNSNCLDSRVPRDGSQAPGLLAERKAALAARSDHPRRDPRNRMPGVTESDRITVAHSPDSDDAFMFFALAEGRVDTEGLSFVHELSDIESLNRRALGGELEVTAVSFHAYAFLAERYLLLPHGASFGDGYGPVVVARRAGHARGDRLRGGHRRIPGRADDGAPGPLALGARRAHRDPSFRRDPRRRPRGAARGRGAHPRGPAHLRARGTPRKSWISAAGGRTRPGCPLPLGGNVVRRDLGPDRIARVSRALSRSIEYGLDAPGGRPHARPALRAGPRSRARRTASSGCT